MVEVAYKPRPAFLGFHARTQRYAIVLSHRQAGKTYAAVRDLVMYAIGNPNGRYAYVAPFRSQAKTVAWDYVKSFTRGLTARPPNESELRVDLGNGARISLYGADNAEALRGLALSGIVLDEMASMAPSTWSQVIRPTLSATGGWVAMIGTPRGHNVFYDAWVQAQADPINWYSARLRADETGILSAAELADARRHQTEEEYAQEYLCSFEAAIRGAYFGKEMAAAEQEGRITDIEPVGWRSDSDCLGPWLWRQHSDMGISGYCG